jgi:hypothetical protein
MSILALTGAYSNALRNWPPSDIGQESDTASWAEAARQIGKEWRTGWLDDKTPDIVRKLWLELMQHYDVSLSQLKADTRCCELLMELAAIADEACAGIGVPGFPLVEEPEELDGDERNQLINEMAFYDYGSSLLEGDDGATLCNEVPPDRLRVLPKMRTPQSGLTIRSLSHNLGLILGNEMTPRWVMLGYKVQESLSINLLVVPWPFDVAPSQFEPTEALPEEMRNMPDEFGFFTFRHRFKRNEPLKTIQALFDRSAKAIGRIDGVVLPECAIGPTEHESIRSFVLSKEAFLISGVSSPSRSGKRYGENCIHFDYPGVGTIRQNKHHCWKLDASQIRQYGIGAMLHPEKTWWEHICVENRELTFLALQNWLVMTILICEDLARPDPVGDLVRAVGPNLVISLLMDGPQLKERWGARYASSLADDPGSSVLTVTSLGMASLSRPATGHSRSRTIALWKNASNAQLVEIELPEGASGVILSLTVEYKTEWTADGRNDDRNAGYPTLSGIHPVRLD